MQHNRLSLQQLGFLLCQTGGKEELRVVFWDEFDCCSVYRWTSMWLMLMTFSHFILSMMPVRQSAVQTVC